MSQVPDEDINLKRPPIRIVSDGTTHATRVYLVSEDGSNQEIPYVTKISWTATAGSPHTCATITLAKSAVDVIGKTEKPSSDDD